MRPEHDFMHVEELSGMFSTHFNCSGLHTDSYIILNKIDNERKGSIYEFYGLDTLHCLWPSWEANTHTSLGENQYSAEFYILLELPHSGIPWYPCPVRGKILSPWPLLLHWDYLRFKNDRVVSMYYCFWLIFNGLSHFIFPKDSKIYKTLVKIARMKCKHKII